MPLTNVTVLSITGWCRNGSTVIGNILNEVDGFFHVGELHFLWRNAFGGGSNSSCGCGKPLRRCDVWSEVLRASAPAGEADARRIVKRQMATIRTRHTWRVLEAASLDEELSQQARSLSDTYQTIARVTGCRVIVDSGKMPAESALLSRMEGVTPIYVHLVRDPRATAHSWSSQKAYISAMAPWRSTAYWLGFNVASHAVTRRHASRSVFPRYEDFIADPASAIDHLLQTCGNAASSNPINGRTVRFGVNHTVTGNPDRFRTGETTIRGSDDEWRAGLSGPAQTVASFISWPLLKRYGYERSTRRAAGAAAPKVG